MTAFIWYFVIGLFIFTVGYMADKPIYDYDYGNNPMYPMIVVLCALVVGLFWFPLVLTFMIKKALN